MDCNLPGSSVHGISQARILESVAMPSSRDRTQVSHIAGRFFTDWAPGKPPGVIEVFIILLLLMAKCREMGRTDIKMCQIVQFKYVWFIACHLCFTKEKITGAVGEESSAFWSHPTSSTFLMYCLVFSVCSYLWTLLFTMSDSSSLLGIFLWPFILLNRHPLSTLQAQILFSE